MVATITCAHLQARSRGPKAGGVPATPDPFSFTFDAGNEVKPRFLVGSDSVIISNAEESVKFTIETPALIILRALQYHALIIDKTTTAGDVDGQDPVRCAISIFTAEINVDAKIYAMTAAGIAFMGLDTEKMVDRSLQDWLF